MTVETVTVSIAVAKSTGEPLTGGRVEFELTATDIHTVIIVPPPEVAVLDEAGLGSIALVPNEGGTQGTRYQVRIFDAGVLVDSCFATIPDEDCNLHDVMNLEPPASVDDAEAAALSAQSSAAAASASAASAAAAAATAATQAIEDYIAAHPTAGVAVVEETPTGTIDGVNTDFTLAHSPNSGTFKLFLNGLRMKRGTDYTQTGASFSYLTAPASGAIHLVDYEH